MARLESWGVRTVRGDYWLKNAAGETIEFSKEQAFDVAYSLTVLNIDEGGVFYACAIATKGAAD